MMQVSVPLWLNLPNMWLNDLQRHYLTTGLPAERQAQAEHCHQVSVDPADCSRRYERVHVTWTHLRY